FVVARMRGLCEQFHYVQSAICPWLGLRPGPGVGNTRSTEPMTERFLVAGVAERRPVQLSICLYRMLVSMRIEDSARALQARIGGAPVGAEKTCCSAVRHVVRSS